MTRLEQLFSFLEIDANDAFTLYSIGYEYYQMNDWVQAIVYFERLTAVHPDYVGVYYHLAKCYQKNNEPNKADATYQKGIEVAQAKSDVHALAELKNAYFNFQMGEED